MSSVPVFVGLDYHQSGVQVCVMNRSGEVLANCKRPDQWQEVARAVAPHGECVQAAIEACSGAADLADQLVQKAGWSVDLAHPGYVARIKQSPDKSDYSDAQLLADLERVGYLPRVWHAPQRIRELRRLVRYRQQLVDQRRNAKLRIRALLRDHRLTLADANPWTKAWRAQLSETPLLPPASRWIMDHHLAEIARLAGQIAQAEEQLAAAIADDPLAQALSALPGVGLVTAAALRAEIGRFDRFRTGKQLARFCGLTPCNASSGRRQADAGLIRAGQPELRRLIIQVAHQLIRRQDRWMKLAFQLKQRGKPTPLVVAAVANRWVRSLHHQFISYGLAA
jgi:transposase